MGEMKRSGTRVKGFKDAEMDFQLIRQLGASTYGGASIGECLSLVSRVKDGVPSSWVEEFEKLAEHQQKDAATRARRGHPISARDHYYRACNSFRAAEYYTPAHTPKHRALGLKSMECFLEAMKHVSCGFEEIMLSSNETDIPMYFMAPRTDGAKRKTLLIVSGFDGTREEEYLCRGRDALERGFNVVLFAGPGQMDTLRFFPGTCFIPDFENPVRSVVDWCAMKEEVDMDRLGLLGISFGGYFAVRAAAREPRIRALIANSPILDLHAYMAAFAGFDPAEMPDEEDFRLEDLPEIPDDIMTAQMKLMAENLMRRFGQPSFLDTFRRLREFQVGDMLKEIRCPCLALVGEGEGGEPEKQFKAFCEGVSGPVTAYRFTAFDGADSHCQVGNLSFAAAVFLDWLSETFA